MDFVKLKEKVEKEYLHKNDCVIIGVSGGPDSMLLLSVLNDLKEELNLRLTVVHIDHSLRAEAKEEANFVQKVCAEKGIECRIFREDVAKIAIEQHMSEEAAGHMVRFRYFAQVMEEISADKLALGHHLADRAESVLMHLLRGASPDGLAVLCPKEEKTIRPLSSLSKEEILAVCAQQNIPYCWDKSNDAPICLRNQIRLELLPYLREKYNPQIDKALCRLSDLAYEDVQYWQKETEKAFAFCQLDQRQVDVKKLNTLPLALRRRTIEYAWQKYTAKRRLDYVQVENILKLAEENCGRKILEIGDYIIIKEYEKLIFTAKDMIPKKEYSFEWDLCRELDVGEYIISAAFEKIMPTEFDKKEKNCVCFDAKNLPQKLLVRTRLDGDVISTEGGRKKVKKLLIDEKIPKEIRDDVPLVFAGTDLLWICGIRRSNLHQVNESTDQVLTLRLKQKK